ncbi:MAG TPA: SRPBCC family protein [Candidatus Limnocylindria bacterium]|jgi:ligand-binding SRPBCC domain-containing protein
MSPRARATVRIRAPRERVFAFHADAANLAAVLPPGVPLRTIGRSALGPGARLRFAFGPFSGTGAVVEWEPPFRFVDDQSFGPFARWHHEHRFVRIGPAAPERDATWVTDTVDFALRGPARVVEPLAGIVVRAILAQKLLRTKALLERGG